MVAVNVVKMTDMVVVVNVVKKNVCKCCSQRSEMAFLVPVVK